MPIILRPIIWKPLRSKRFLATTSAIAQGHPGNIDSVKTSNLSEVLDAIHKVEKTLNAFAEETSTNFKKDKSTLVSFSLRAWWATTDDNGRGAQYDWCRRQLRARRSRRCARLDSAPS
ncbi:hypothetical protein BDZ89DRAFT_1037387 [Hymenopellis radicata]|nr:hypothetical protein BDZ89DRAFT_1037387 [Hymenopellis radicata]